MDKNRAHLQDLSLYQMLVETMNDGLLIRDRNSIITFANRRFCEMLGFSGTEEVIGHPVENFLDEDNVRILNQEVEKRAVGECMPYEIAFRHTSGRLIHTNVSPGIIRDDAGNYKESFAVITDISSYRDMLGQLNESKLFLENVFKTSVDAILIADSRGDIIMANQAVENIFGYSLEEVIGRHTSDFLPHDEYSSVLGAKMMEVLFKRNTVEGFEAEFKKKDGTLLSLEFSINLIRDAKGDVSGAVAFVRDVTDKKRYERQIFQSEKLKSIAELSTGVAHDFNNVLAAILGRAQLLRKHLVKLDDSANTDQLIKGIDIIEQAVLEGSETVNNLQEFGRAHEPGQGFEPVDLKKIINDSLSLALERIKSRIDTEGIRYKITRDIDDDLPEISGVRSELMEVFTHIFKNSFDEMDRGGEIRITGGADAQNITIVIGDSGSGVSKELKDRIFDPFFTTKGPQASGLGLSVAYGIISRHNGTISARQPEKGGVEMVITLPLSGKLPGKTASVMDCITGVTYKSVLIVEDEASVRNLLFDLVSDEYPDTSVAADGVEGLRRFKERHYDLVITDLGMPGMSGIELTKEIKKISESTPVILITGWDVHEREEEIKKDGVDVIIKKPFHLDQVVDALHKVQQKPAG